MKQLTQAWLVSAIFLFSCQGMEPETEAFFSAQDPHFGYQGRFFPTADSGMAFAWSASEIRVAFRGSQCILHLETTPLPDFPTAYGSEVWFRVQIDEAEPLLLLTTPGQQDYPLADSLSPGLHQLSLYRRTEAETGLSIFRGLSLSPGGTLAPGPSVPERKIIFYGNSITCGYGNEGDSRDCPFSPATENAWASYAALTARALKADYQTICFSGRGVFQNYSKTRTGTLPQLYDRYFPGQAGTGWDFTQFPANWVVVNLGTNDFAHGAPEADAFQSAYLGFVRDLRTAYPDAYILLLSGPMMSGTPLQQLQDHLTQLQKTMQDEKVLRFELTPQGPLDYGCDWHPNLAQHELNAGELTTFIRARSGW